MRRNVSMNTQHTDEKKPARGGLFGGLFCLTVVQVQVQVQVQLMER